MKTPILAVLIVAICLAIVWVMGNLNQSNNFKFDLGKTVLYYGNTCTHCQDLEEQIIQNKIENKVSIEKKEVFQNRTNANELEKVGNYCKIEKSNMGVPLLFAEGKCYQGKDEALKYLLDKAT